MSRVYLSFGDSPKPGEAHRHYFDEGELAIWFSTLETLLYEEIMKYDDSHGLPHYHGLARLIARKQNVGAE